MPCTRYLVFEISAASWANWPTRTIMGVTVHYRGSLADLGRLEDFEDRVIDLALAVGGNPRLWRSANERDPSRMVRGLMVDLAPGQETTSLLISPEGWLIGLMQIEDAENGALDEKPWCWCETQFGPIEGHVALVELLTGLKAEFMPDLEVMDESGYWEHRNVGVLREKIEFLGRAIDLLAGELEDDRLSPEAREDAEILATRIERLARKVRATLSRPSEHPPVHFPDEEAVVPPDPTENEARWDALFAENRRKQERMERVVEEGMIQGQDPREAFREAIEEVVPPVDWDDDDEDDDETAAWIAEMNEACRAAVEEPLQTSISEAARGDARENQADDGDDEFAAMEKHSLQRRATTLLTELFHVAKRADDRTANLDTLIRNAMEVTGGLAQVLPLPPEYEIDDIEAGHSLVQLKRALRGAAFVRGTLFLLRSETSIDDEEFRRFLGEADAVSSEITDLLRTVREAGSNAGDKFDSDSGR